MSAPILIRGITYDSAIAAAKAIGVQTAAIFKARAKGTLNSVGLDRQGKTLIHYDAQKDAEYILENIMHRQNWSIDVRDNLQAHLETVTRAKLWKAKK